MILYRFWNCFVFFAFMKIHLRLIAILGVICLSPFVYAQKNGSYVILSQGDTLHGKIRMDVSGHIKLKNDDGGESIRYRPDELIGYYSGRRDKVFITINPEDDNHGP